jgi:hypothetical protein
MAKRNGHDKLGIFEIKAGQCGICKAGNSSGNMTSLMVVQYKRTPRVDEYVSQAKALLIRNKKTGNFIRTIGINCGCYSKVHRQITHIAASEK